MSANGETRPVERRPEGKEGAGSHQEGPNSLQTGQTQRRGHSEPEKNQPDQANDRKKPAAGKE